MFHGGLIQWIDHWAAEIQTQIASTLIHLLATIIHLYISYILLVSKHIFLSINFFLSYTLYNIQLLSTMLFIKLHQLSSICWQPLYIYTSYTIYILLVNKHIFLCINLFLSHTVTKYYAMHQIAPTLIHLLSTITYHTHQLCINY